MVHRINYHAHNSSRYQIQPVLQCMILLFETTGLERTPCETIQTVTEATQKQEGGSDCGLYTIANVVELLSGSNPTKVQSLSTTVNLI